MASPSVRPTLRMQPIDWLSLLALSLLWGGAFFFSKIAVGALPPLVVVLGRVVLAAACLWLVMLATGTRIPAQPRMLLGLLLLGLINNIVPFGLIFWAQTHIASGLASILNATTPLFTAVLAHLLTGDDRLTPARLAGIGLGVAGVAVLLGPQALGGLVGEGALLAQLACLGAALSYGFAGIWGRRVRGLPPLAMATGQVTASSLLLLPVVLLVEAPWSLPMPGLAPLGALLGLGTISTALAYVLFFRVLARAGATNVSLVTLLIPVSAVLLGTAFLGERLEMREIAGMALIGLGLLALDGRVWAWVKQR